MRFFIPLALVGCATIHQPVGEEPPVVTYFGTAKGAVDIVEAQRSFDLAQAAMDKGQPVNLQMTDTFVGFTTGNGYVTGSGLYGYAPADVVSTTSGWYMGTGQGGSLPRLGTTVVQNVSHDNSLVPCPKDRKRANPAEQAACAEEDVTLALHAIQEQK